MTSSTASAATTSSWASSTATRSTAAPATTRSPPTTTTRCFKMRNEFDSGLFHIADADPATVLDLDTRELQRRVQHEIAVGRELVRQRRRGRLTLPKTRA